jgi:hypothetical protein
LHQGGVARVVKIADRQREVIEHGHRVAVLGLEAHYGDPLASVDYVTLALRNYHDSGSAMNIRSTLAVLAVLFDRLGRYESALTIAGFAVSLSPYAVPALPEFNTALTHLRDVLGDQTYESLARKGKAMSTAEMVAYAYDQIDQVRTELNAVSK